LRNDDVLRRNKGIDRRDRADRAHVVTTNREFVAEEEALEDGNAIHERERVCVFDFLGGGEAADSSGDDTEAENFRVLRLLTPHREKLRVRQRRLISAYVTKQSSER